MGDDRAPDRLPEEEVLGSSGVRRRRKLYIVERCSWGLSCTVRTGESEEKLRHHVRHSPTGFECGYGGSGPADLARCILIDLLDADRPLTHDDARRTVEQHYQAFKAEFIATRQCPPSWELTGEEILDWLAARS